MSVRLSDTAAQTAVLQRCQATRGLTAQNYLTMAALCRQSGASAASQQACLKAALRHMSQQMPITEFELIAQVSECHASTGRTLTCRMHGICGG